MAEIAFLFERESSRRSPSCSEAALDELSDVEDDEDGVVVAGEDDLEKVGEPGDVAKFGIWGICCRSGAAKAYYLLMSTLTSSSRGKRSRPSPLFLTGGRGYNSIHSKSTVRLYSIF